MSRGKVNVYARDLVTVLATVSPSATSIGAARAAGVGSCRYEKVDGKWSWVAQ